MDIIITGVGEDPYQIISEVDEDDQYGIRTTVVSKDTEKEEAMDEDVDDDENVSEDSKY